MAALIAAMFELHRDSEKRQEPYTVEDFLSGGDDAKPRAPLTPENTVRLCQALNAAFGGETIEA